MLHVPAPVVRIIGRLMEKDPEDRFQTPIELANELQPLVSHLVDGTLPKDEPEGPPRSRCGCCQPPQPLPATLDSDSAVARHRAPLLFGSRRAGRPPATDGVGTLVAVLAAIGGLGVAFLPGASSPALMLRLRIPGRPLSRHSDSRASVSR